MRSSTSSSSSPAPAGAAARSQGGWRTAAFVVVTLLLCEVAVRAIEPRISEDMRHTASIDDILEGLEDAGEPDGDRTLLFLGNSLTRRGVDLAVFGDELAQRGVNDITTAAVFPDDTSVLDWLYLYQHEVITAEVVPDVVVIGFSYRHLDDGPLTRAQTHRLGRSFISWTALSGLYANDVTLLPDRVNVLMSKVSVLFANRERIAKRILSLLPHYQESARIINERNLHVRAADGEAAAATLDRLRRLIATVEGSGAELILLAMPILEAYPLDPRIAELADAGGAVLVDARHVPGLSDEHFEDDLHLLPATGGVLFSRHAGELLAPLLFTPEEVR